MGPFIVEFLFSLCRIECRVLLRDTFGYLENILDIPHLYSVTGSVPRACSDLQGAWQEKKKTFLEWDNPEKIT